MKKNAVDICSDINLLSWRRKTTFKGPLSFSGVLKWPQIICGLHPHFPHSAFVYQFKKCPQTFLFKIIYFFYLEAASARVNWFNPVSDNRNAEVVPLARESFQKLWWVFDFFFLFSLLFPAFLLVTEVTVNNAQCLLTCRNNTSFHLHSTMCSDLWTFSRFVVFLMQSQ